MTPEQFDAQFYRLVNEGMSKADAFWLLNNATFEEFGKYKYSDYTSYRISKHKRLRRRNQ